MREQKISLLSSVAVASMLVAGCAAAPVKQALDPGERIVPGGREAVVLIPQGEIRADVLASTGGAAFGLIGAVVDASVTQNRANKAEAAIRPVRDALNGYDFDQRALVSTQETARKLDWLDIRRVSFSKDISNQSLLGYLDRSESSQVAFTTYDYALTADFAALRVTSRVSISPTAPRAGDSPEDRIKLHVAAYSRTFAAIVPLANPGTDVTVNALRWANDSGKLAREALEDALDRVQMLIERSLRQTPGEVANLATGETVAAGGQSGKLIDRDDNGTLLMDATGAWIYVKNTPIG